MDDSKFPAIFVFPMKVENMVLLTQRENTEQKRCSHFWPLNFTPGVC